MSPYSCLITLVIHSVSILSLRLGSYPEKLSDKLAHEKFDFYSVEQYIVIKFSDSRLSYLAVEE